MSLTPDSIRRVLDQDPNLTPSHVHVEYISANCGPSFSILVVSDAFRSQKLLACHRLVHTALQNQMPSIHALKLKCLTPEAHNPS